MAFVLMPFYVSAQSRGVEVDYNRPKTYTVAGVGVEGNTYFNDQQIISLTGLQKGLQVTVPGEDIS
ncbi:MAG: hypothetical protein IIU68_03975, partial [Bacteroidales bacterium]|nr:hypothetical protein [Bacteroidales bacterium]